MSFFRKKENEDDFLSYPKFFGIYAAPSRRLAFLLGVAPFVFIIVGYLVFSYVRLKENPSDNLAPSVSTMTVTIYKMATKEDLFGHYPLWHDTLASMRRFGTGLGMAALFGLIVGINMGSLPGLNCLLNPLIRFLSIIPAFALLPFLIKFFGIDELGKIMLIFIGTAFMITRDMLQTTEQFPEELKSKALTLHASQFQVIYEIILPQVLPRLLVALRNSLGTAWILLLAVEGISSEAGLGYRLIILRNKLRMDVTIPYVLWITLIGYSMDMALRKILEWKYAWFLAKK